MSARLWVAPAAVSEEAAPAAVPVARPVAGAQGQAAGARGLEDEARRPEVEDREADRAVVPVATMRNQSELR
jgi:hypothetical protein